MGAGLIVDLQLNQGAADWPRMREAVLAAEEAGFSTLWNLDHFSGAMFGADSMSECFTSLGAWAAVTRTIGLGTLVVNAVNRSAGLLAHSAATVQQVSGGRFTLGIGAGAAPGSKWAAEHDALGTRLLPTMTERHRHLADTVSEVRRILSLIKHGEARVNFHHEGLEPAMQTFERSTNRLSFAIVIGTVIIGSSLIIRAEVPPMWNGVSVIGLLGFLLAGLLGLMLLLAILRHGRM